MRRGEVACDAAESARLNAISGASGPIFLIRLSRMPSILPMHGQFQFGTRLPRQPLWLHGVGVMLTHEYDPFIALW